MNAFQEGWKNFKNLWTSEKYVCFKGRASRSEYWTTILIVVLLSIGATLLDLIFGAITGFDSFAFISTIFSIAIVLPMTGLQFRRLHDVGRSGWWLGAMWIISATCLVLLVSLAIMGIWTLGLSDYLDIWQIPYQVVSHAFFIVILWIALVALGITNFVFTLLKGQEGPNRYGDCPCTKKSENIVDATFTVIQDNKEDNKEDKSDDNSSDSQNHNGDDSTPSDGSDNYVI